MARRAYKKELRERWETTSGSETKRALFSALVNGAAIEEIRFVLSRLPLCSEIPSGLDLRGLRELPLLSKLDLSGASLDYTSMYGPVMDCDLSRASLVEFDARGLHLISRLSGARLERANLANALLMGANFSGADLTKAKLTSASMRDVDLTGAKLVEADLRFAHLARARLVGADFTGARVVEASLGEATWDETTIVRDADFTGASLDEAFAAFVREGGAKVGESEGALELAEFDGTVLVLDARNDDGRLDEALDLLRALRERVLSDPNFDWASALARQVPPTIFEEVEEAVRESIVTLSETD